MFKKKKAFLNWIFGGMIVYFISTGVVSSCSESLFASSPTFQHILGALAGLLSVIFRFNIKKSLSKVKHIDVKEFLFLFGTFCFTLLIGIFSYRLLDKFFNIFGFTGLRAAGQILSSAYSKIPLWGTIYICAIGPLLEELVFRGYLMGKLKCFGKVNAIIMSAIVFALFHGNFCQSINSFFLGVVFGYVAMEYSLVWASLFHIINNAVLVVGTLAVADCFSISPMTLKFYICSVFACIAFYLFFFGGMDKKIKEYVASNKLSWKFFTLSLSIPCFILIVVFFIWVMLSYLSPVK